jgi:hypothetical protein
MPVSRHAFADRCREVCEAHGWELLPTGILVQWGNGRKQLVRLETFESEGRSLVRLSTTIGSVEALSRDHLLLALEANSDLAHGALAVHARDLCMTDTLMLESCDVAQIEAAIEFLASRADEYEHSIYRTDVH